MELFTVQFVSYCLLGVFAGLLGGMLGVGGGIVIVPALYFIFTWQQFPTDIIMHLAVSTSLATIIFTAISSSYAHHQRQAVLWPKVKMLIPGVIVGAIIGALVADTLPSNTLRIMFGVFEILVAIQIWFRLQPKAEQSLPDNIGLVIAGFIIGVISTVLGIGGGTIIVPFLLWCCIDIRHAVGTSSACGLPIALAGVIAFMWVGWNHPALPEYSVGYIYLPAAIGITLTSIVFAPLGAKIAHKLPKEFLQRLFAIVIFIVGVRILS